MTLTIAGSQCWVRIGWTMLHFLWIGSLAGLGAWASKSVLKGADAGTRYLAALGWLALLAALPLAIALSVDPVQTSESLPVPLGPERYPAEARAVSSSEVVTSRSPPGLSSTIPLVRPSVREEVPTGGRFHWRIPSWTGVATALPWIWVLGSPLVFAWSMAGLAGAERLRRLSSPLGDRQLDALCRRLARSLNISRQVSIRVCARIASPLLVGIVRPVILLPPALLTGLTPEQMEMLLLHELAHVRRWDNLINFVQRLIESLLFFHPAVWLVSRWVRQEREHCCDALVLGRLGDRESYAETLLAVVRRGLAGRRLDLALATVAGGPASAMGRRDVRARIDRILRWEDETMQVSRRLGVVVPVALLAAVAIGTTFGLSQERAGPRGESAPATPAEAESEDPSQQEASQQGPVDAPDRGVPRRESTYSITVEAPISYIAEGEDSFFSNTLLLSENPTPGEIQARDGAVSEIKPPTCPSERVPFERGDLPRPSSRHPGGINRFYTHPYVDDEVFFSHYIGLINQSSTDSRAAYAENYPPYPKIFVPYELDDDCLVIQDGTISSLFFASGLSQPETSTEPPPEEEQPKPGSQGEVRWVNQPKKAVWINLGREDGLEKGTELRVYGRAKEDGSSGDKKGTIVVTRILGDHLSEARIEQDRADNPIIPGDRIHSLLRKDPVAVTVTRKEVVSSEPAELSGALRKQVEELRQELRRLQQERDQLVNDRVRLTDELNDLRVERQKLQEEMKDAQQGRAEGREAEVEIVDVDKLYANKGDGTFTDVWPGSVRGVVSAVSGKGLVEISIGSDDGLRKGQRAEVYRLGNRTCHYVGRVEVIETQPDRAVCRVLAEFLQRPVQKGDRVATRFPARSSAAAPRPVQMSGSLTIDANGMVTFDRAKTTPEEMAQVLSAARQGAAVRVLITAHPETEHGHVLKAIEALQEAGIRDLSVEIQSDEQDPGPTAPEPTLETLYGDAETLYIDAAGGITVNGKQVTVKGLPDVLGAGAEQGIRASVLIACDRDAKHERVVEVLDACEQAGISAVRLVVVSDEEETGPVPQPEP